MVWGAIVKFGAKISAKIGAKAAAKTAGKTAAKVGFKKFGFGALAGGVGVVGLSNYLGGGSLVPSLSFFNPLSEDFNLIWFAVVAIVLIAFLAKFRR